MYVISKAGSIHTNVPVNPECPKLEGDALFAG
jgi:hypothetical protein